MNGMPDSFIIYVDGTEVGTDDGAGGVTDTNAGDIYAVDGSFDYITGDWELEFVDPVGDTLDITLDYNFVDDADLDTYTLVTSGTTDDFGTYDGKRVNVPDEDIADLEGDWFFVAYDSDGNLASADFSVYVTRTFRDLPR